MNNEAPELSPEARRIISEARGFDDPSPEDRARVKARWLAGVAAVAGVSSLTEAARAAGGIGWGLKAAGAALVLAAGAVGIHFELSSDDSAQPGKSAPSHAAARPGWSGTTHERFEKTSAAAPREPQKTTAFEPQAVERKPVAPRPGMAEPLAPVAPSIVAQPIEAAPRAVEGLEPAEGVVAAAPVEAAPEGLRPAPVARREGTAARTAMARPKAPKERSPAPGASPAPEASPTSAGSVPAPEAPNPGESSGQLGEELSLLSEVRSSVQEGAPNRALDLLARYEARFGQPILGMEADALRVDALCKAGQRDAARASARAFQNEWPGSPLERRVSAACP